MQLLSPRVSRRVFVSLSVVAALVVSTSCSARQEPPPVSAPARYSYFTKSELVVMEDTREVVRKKVAYKSQYRGAVWTLDARYVAVVFDTTKAAEPTSRKLLVINAASGESREIACPDCGTVAPIGGSKIVVVSTDEETGYLDTVLRFDLSDSRPPVRLPGVDPKDASISFPVFVSGADGAALLTGLDEDGRTVYYLYNLDGTAASVGADSYNQVPYRSFEGGAVTRTSDGTVRFASAEGKRHAPKACASAGAITLGSSGKPNPIFTDMSVVTPVGRTAGLDALVATMDMWWERNGELHAVLWSATCDGKLREASKPAEWRLAGTRWVKISDAPVLAARPVGSARVLLLNDSPNEQAATLKLEADGKQTTIAGDAQILSAPPIASVDHLSVDGPSQSSSPTPSGPGSFSPTSSPATSTSRGLLAGSSFVGKWFVHGGSMTIRSDGTGTQSYKYSWCAGEKSACYTEYALDVRLSADKKIATATVKSMRIVIYGDDSKPTPVVSPTWDGGGAPPDEIGRVYRFQFTASNIMKDLNGSETEGNPFWCSATNPPPDNGPCGA